MMNKFRGPEDPNFKLVSGRIKDVVEKARTEPSLTSDEQDCMQALSFDYQDQKNLNPERVQETCEWFLNHPKFLAWRRETTADLLLVTAGPGCGKSVLSKALIDEGLLDPDNPDIKTTTTCYFFFKNDAERGSAVNGLRSILHQLFRQKPWLIQHAVRDYEAYGRELPLGTLWAILMKAVADKNTGPVICLLDALDECESSKRKPLIKYLSSFHRDLKTTESRLKFIVTSRPYHELIADFGMEVNDLPSIHLDGDEMSEKFKREIDVVIKHEISRIGSARKPPLDDKTQASLIKRLKAQDNRTYLWVYLMLQEISRSLESSERKLNRLLQAIPHSVDDAYEKILKRATDPIQANRVLGFIVAAERPLTWKEMNIALEIAVVGESGEKCVSEDDLELDKQEAFRTKIRNLCGLFVNIFDQKVYLIHQTAKEFLICDRGSVNPWSSCWKHTFTIDGTHLGIATSCIRYLLLENLGNNLFDNITKSAMAVSPTSSISSDSTTEEGEFALDGFTLGDVVLFEDEEDLHDKACVRIASKHQAYDYAALYWTHHYALCEHVAPPALKSQASMLLEIGSPRLANWYKYVRHQSRNTMPPLEELNALLAAAIFDHTISLRALIVQSSSKTADTETALFWAVRRDHLRSVKILLEHNIHPNRLVHDQSPLMIAVQRGHTDMCIALLNTGIVDLSFQDKRGQTALMLAAEHNHLEILRQLLRRPDIDVMHVDSSGSSALLTAATTGSIDCVKELIRDGRFNINHTDVNGRNALLQAARYGRDTIIRILLKSPKLALDVQDRFGRNALSYAAQTGHLGIVRLLVRAKLSISQRDYDGRNAISWAANSSTATITDHDGHCVLSYLISKDKSAADQPDNDGWSPLTWAVEPPAHLKALKLLIENGAVDTNRKDKISGRTVFSRAAAENQLEAIKYLLTVPTLDINLVDDTGRTPLSHAASGGCLEAMRVEIMKLMLRQKNIDVLRADSTGRMARDWALLQGYHSVARELELAE